MNTQIEARSMALVPPPGTQTLDSDELKQTEFTAAVRVWAEGARSKNTGSQYLISFGSAIDLVNDAIGKSETQIDIPLMSHLSILGMDKELEEFSRSIIPAGTPSIPMTANSSLFSKFSTGKGIDIKIDELKIKNEGVVTLLSQLREALAGISVGLYGRSNLRTDSNSPQYYIRISLRNSEIVEMPNSPVQLARLRAREGLALPAEADDRYVENERQNVIYVNRFRELLHTRHKQLLEDPLTVNSGVLINDRDSPLQISELSNRFSHYHLNKARLGLEILVASALVVPSVTLGLGIGLISGCVALLIGGPPLEGRGLKRMRATDPLNTIQSPSIRELIKEIRELGYSPKLEVSYPHPYRFTLVVHTTN